MVESSPQTAVRPIFDILGAKEVNTPVNNPSPLDCFTDGRFIQTLKKHTVETSSSSSGGGETKCITDISIPVNGASHSSRVNWSCVTPNPTNPTGDFYSIYTTHPNTNTSIL